MKEHLKLYGYTLDRHERSDVARRKQSQNCCTSVTDQCLSVRLESRAGELHCCGKTNSVMEGVEAKANPRNRKARRKVFIVLDSHSIQT